MTWLRVLLVAAAAVYAAGFLIAALFSDRLILPAPPSAYRTLEPDMVRIPSGGGESLVGLWLPRADAAYTVLYSHGNFEDLAWVRPRLELLHDLGFQVLGYDYRGYGLSDGRATVASAADDARTAYAYLRQDMGIPAERIVLYGRSVGGGPSLQLATEEPVAGVILESTFTSAFRVVTGIRLFPFDRYENDKRIREVDAPILLLHGRADRVVPFRHGPALLEAAPEPTQHAWFTAAGHNDIPERDPKGYEAAIRSFVAELDVGRSAGARDDAR